MNGFQTINRALNYESLTTRRGVTSASTSEINILVNPFYEIRVPFYNTNNFTLTQKYSNTTTLKYSPSYMNYAL